MCYLFLSKECTRQWGESAAQLTGVCSFMKAPPAVLCEVAVLSILADPQQSCRLALSSLLVQHLLCFVALRLKWFAEVLAE